MLQTQNLLERVWKIEAVGYFNQIKMEATQMNPKKEDASLS